MRENERYQELSWLLHITEDVDRVELPGAFVRRAVQLARQHREVFVEFDTERSMDYFAEDNPLYQGSTLIFNRPLNAGDQILATLAYERV